MARSDRRTELQEAALRVAHQHGLVGVTLATVAEAAGAPLGGIYYYYKTRDEMLVSVVDRMEMQMESCVAGFEATGSPEAALGAFVDFVLGNHDALARFGCPIGTLAAQMRKEPGQPGERMGAILGRMADWAACKFAGLGLGEDQARSAGRRLLVRLEGAAMMAHATGDALYVTEIVEEVSREIARLAGQSALEGKA
jgi:TetR/AcrR family transcriptional regulator, transcriptional repressor for nem operon